MMPRDLTCRSTAAIPEVVGQLEARWLATHAGRVGLVALLSAFLDGELPTHAPAVLRPFVARRYSIHDRLSELARLLFDEPEAA